jgi:hypothetical protein
MLPDRSSRLYEGPTDADVFRLSSTSACFFPDAIAHFRNFEGDGNGLFLCNLEVEGKLSGGGMDPPYVLLDSETRVSVAGRVAREVPP